MPETSRKLTYNFVCTNFGAILSSKKTLYSAQNIENKGSEFFLPSRSMVLKVVTGKIFKTLGLSWSVDNRLPDGCRGFQHLGTAAEIAPKVRLSKTYDYLIDNVYVCILSYENARGQEESGQAADRVPHWESRAHSFRKEHREGWTAF